MSQEYTTPSFQRIPAIWSIADCSSGNILCKSKSESVFALGISRSFLVIGSLPYRKLGFYKGREPTASQGLRKSQRKVERVFDSTAESCINSNPNVKIGRMKKMCNGAKKDKIDDVTRLRDAANTFIKFFDEVIEIADRFKAVEKEYNEITDKINPTVLVYSKVHDILACKKGMNAFLENEEMKLIRKTLSEKEQELRRHFV
jgi:hypothetical protein